MQTALSESMPCDFEVAPFHPTLPPADEKYRIL